jgi:hypothetical protein
MKQLQRLLFQQGNRCFFCDAPIPEGQASVEHLEALSNGGAKSDENSVACCKTVNSVLGNLSVKEKLRIVLGQRRAFECPGREGFVLDPELTQPIVVGASAEQLLPSVVENLRKRGAARPSTLPKLQNAVAASFPEASTETVSKVMLLLKEGGHVRESGGKLSYADFEPGA